MTREIYIHIGTHKTGTSSFQNTLIDNSNKLKEVGAKYINLYNFERAKHLMEAKDYEEKLTSSLKIFIDSHITPEITRYIICCEYLSGNPKLLYSNVSTVSKILYNSLSAFDVKKIFAVIRKQDQFIQSLYTQFIHQAENFHMEELLDEKKLQNIKWTNFLKSYEDIFGSENLKAIPYDRKILTSNNLVKLFGEFSGIKLSSVLEMKSLNTGYNKKAMRIANLCNPHLDISEQKILRSLLQRHFNKGVFSDYDILNEEEKITLDKYFQEDNKTLFKKYFTTFNIDSYSNNVITNSKGKTNSAFLEDYVSEKLIVLLLREISSKTKQLNLNRKLNFQDLISLTKEFTKRGVKRIRGEKKLFDYDRNKELREHFSSFQNTVILGSSSSINKLDITKFSKDMVITVGNFYEHPQINEINPKVHIFAASHPPINREVLIEWWSRCSEVLPKSTILLIEKRDRAVAEMVFKNHKLYFYSYGGNLPVDFTKPIMSPWSVTIVALQLAIYCKIQTIGILGVNHDWQCTKPYTHFYDHNKPSLEYYLSKAGVEISYEKQKQPFPKERLYREYELYQQYEALKNEADKLNIKIFNYDPFSDFDMFEFEKKMDLIKS